jgi:hypothetical protein
MQREPNSVIDDFGILCGGVIMPEQTGVRRDSKPTFTEHYKGTQCRDSIEVEVEQLAVQIAMMVTRNLLGGSPSPANKCDLKQIMVEPSTVGTSTSGTEEITLPVSQSHSW